MNQQKNRTFIYWLIALGAFCFAAACAFGYVIFNTILRGSEDQRSTVEIVSHSEPAYQPETETAPDAESETNANVETPPLGTGDDAAQLPTVEPAGGADRPTVTAGTRTAETEGTEDEDEDSAKNSEANVRTVEELSEAQQKVISKVEEIRGLTASEPLTVIFKSREELHEEIVKNFRSALTDQDFQDERELFTLLGFIHADFDVEGLYEALYTEQVAGYYDHDQNVMMLIEEADPSETLRTLAHEYTHFLQFSSFPTLRQYYNAEFCELHGDDCILARSVIEGDAVLTESLAVQDPLVMRLLNKNRATGNNDDSTFRNAPPYYQESILLEYVYGFPFVYTYFLNDGFESVNELLSAPPASVEQLIHPEKYGTDEPENVSIGLFDKVFADAGCEFVRSSVFNELDTRWMLTLGVDPGWRIDERSAARASEGWSGGTFSFGRCDGKPYVFSETQWDSRRDSAEFSDGMEMYFDARFGAAESAGSWIGQGEKIRLLEADNSVFFMIVPEEFDLTKIERMIEKIEYSEEVDL